MMVRTCTAFSQAPIFPKTLRQQDVSVKRHTLKQSDTAWLVLSRRTKGLWCFSVKL